MWVSNLKRTPILVLFALLFVGVGAASAGFMTTISGPLTADNYFDNGNTQTGTDASALGGLSNTASGDWSTVGGGETNIASGNYATIGGGDRNEASLSFSTVGGGQQNAASGSRSTVPGGVANTASGDQSFAAGTLAHAMHNGAFVWQDKSLSSFQSTAEDQFSIKAGGGVRIVADVTVGGDHTITGTYSGIGIVPIGTVLDWWCPLGCTIPDGFVMADGQLISDAASPFDGQNVPDLTNTFVKGVTPTNLDTTGGTSTHSHSHDHANAVSSSAGAAHTHSHDHDNTGTSNNNGNHVHSVNPPNSPTDTHNHAWARLGADEDWDSFNIDGNTEPMITWTNGLDGDGMGIFVPGKVCPGNNCTIELFYTNNDSHSHNIPAFNSATNSANHGHSVNLLNQESSAGNANHEHNTNLPNIQSSTENNEPPWHGLVKIIRIK